MKTTFLTLALCIMCANAKAQTVSVADVEALPGETVSFSLDLSGGKVDTYIALQFDVQFPNNSFTTTGDYSVSSKWKNAISVVGSVDEDGVATIPVASAESISEANVEGLLTIDFTVGSSVPVGEYDVTLKNLWFGYGISSKDYVDDVTFKVRVVTQHTAVLDEDATSMPAEATGVNVTVKRTINANEWSTLCLPFDMSEEQVKATFGDDVQLAYFESYDVEKDGSDVLSITINFEDDDLSEGFYANYPYLIKTSKDITEFSLNNVSIEPDDVQQSYSSGKGSNKKSGKFIGTYQANTAVPENSLFLSGNKFWYSTGLTKMKAFRAYFTIDDVLTNMGNADSRIQLSFNDEPTGVKTIERTTLEDERYYNLKGQRVEKPVKGIYVKNGKKIVVH